MTNSRPAWQEPVSRGEVALSPLLVRTWGQIRKRAPVQIETCDTVRARNGRTRRVPKTPSRPPESGGRLDAGGMRRRYSSRV